MELSKSLQEVITQAQMLRLETNGSTLCVEHLFYGLLLMACYREKPMDAPEYRQEAEKLRFFLDAWVLSIASAKRQLKEDAEEDDSFFADAKETLGRAAEMAGDNPITPMELARAIKENQTPTVRALSGLRIPAALKEDEKYHPKQAEEALQQQAAQISGVQPAPKPVQKPDPKPVQKPAPAEPVGKEKEEDNEYARIAAALRLLDQQENPKDKRGREKQRQKEAARRGKKRTKIGLITWRGGPVAAAFQYLLAALLIPFAALFALEHFTGFVKAPPTPWAEFGIRIFILLSLFFVIRALIALIRAITVSAGGNGQSVSLFLRNLSDLALIAGIMHSVGKVFYGAGLLSPEFPQWLKIVGSVAAVFVMTFCAVLYGVLNYTEQQKMKKIKYSRMEGRVSQVMLGTVTRQLLLPTAVLLGLWIHDSAMEDWQLKTLWILGFIFAWNVPNIIISCISLATSARWYRGGGEGFFKFLRLFYIFLFVPLLVLFLHWLFSWFPMQLWVMIALGIYTLLAAVFSLIHARS